MKKVLAVLALVGLGSSCAPEYGHVSLFKIHGQERSVVDRTGIIVGEGEVMVFEAHARAASDERPYEGLEQVELRAAESAVAIVRPSILADAWVVSGTSEGTTQLLIEVDGELVESLTIDVERWQ
ncbi:MAG: hypothetical protein AAF799_26415 [Myxococcota bacterium]